MGAQRGSGVLLVLILLAPLSSSAVAGYAVTDLGVLPGGSVSRGLAVNNSGMVTGWGDTATSNAEAYVSGPGGISLRSLGLLTGGGTSHGTAINAVGMVAGDGETSDDGIHIAVHAFRGSTQGSLQDLGLLSGWVSSHATAISDSGKVGGYGTLVGGTTHAFVTDASGAITDLGTFGGVSSQVNGINRSGELVGSYLRSTGESHAFVVSAQGAFHDLGGFPDGSGSSFGIAINQSGRVTGYGGTTGAFFAFRSAADGILVNLGTLTGASSSFGLGINSQNDVVGTAFFGSGFTHAFLYKDDSGIVDLNSLIDPKSGWVLSTATGINDAGQITGTGLYRGETHAFLLTSNSPPVPEPSSAFLVGLGIICWIVTRRPAFRLGSENPLLQPVNRWNPQTEDVNGPP